VSGLRPMPAWFVGEPSGDFRPKTTAWRTKTARLLVAAELAGKLLKLSVCALRHWSSVTVMSLAPALMVYFFDKMTGVVSPFALRGGM